MKKMLLFTLSVLMTAQLLQGQALHPSAAFEISSTTKGFLPPRLTTTQRIAIQNPAIGLIVYNTDEQSMEIHIGSGEWVKVSTNSGIKLVSSLLADASEGDTFFNTTSTTLNIFREKVGWYSFKTNAAGFIGEEIEHNNLTYKTTQSVGTGKIWLDRNMGATKAPASIGDVGTNTETEFGRFYSWNDAQTACPTGYRLPTKAEWELEIAGFANHGGQDANGAWGSLKLTLTGYRSSGSGALGSSYVGALGYYWSSTDDGSTTNAKPLLFASSSAAMTDKSKSIGYAVRCIKDD